MPGGLSEVSRQILTALGHRMKIIDPYRFASASTLLDDLVAWWSMDETSGTRVNDHNPGTHDLTDNNTVGYTTGIQGNAALAAVASTEYLSCASHADLVIGDRDYTIAGWCYFSSASNTNGGIISRAGTSEWSLRRGGGTEQTVHFVVRNSTNTAAVATANVAITYDAWFFAIAYYDAANDLIGLEVNRASPVTAALAGGSYSAAAGDLRVCRSNNAYLNGACDEMALWTRLLTVAEKDALYNSGNGMAYPG